MEIFFLRTFTENQMGRTCARPGPWKGTVWRKTVVLGSLRAGEAYFRGLGVMVSLPAANTSSRAARST